MACDKIECLDITETLKDTRKLHRKVRSQLKQSQWTIQQYETNAQEMRAKIADLETSLFAILECIGEVQSGRIDKKDALSGIYNECRRFFK